MRKRMDYSDIKILEENGVVEVGIPIGDKMMVIQTGKLAKQASGAALVRFGDSVVLMTVVASPLRREIDYFPLSVDFEERMYSAGKMPGGFLKREGRSSEHSTLTARQIDRPIRPLFDKKMKYEVQVVGFCLSSDMENPLDVCGIVGASACLAISDIPWDGPVAGVRVGRVDGEFIINPTFEQMEKGDISLVVAGTEDSLNMVEGELKELPEEDMLKALEVGHEAIRKIIAAQRMLIEKVGKKKFEYEVEKMDEALIKQIEEFALPEFTFKLMENKKDEMFDLAHDFNCKVVRVIGGIVLPNPVHKPFHMTVSRRQEIKTVAKNLKSFVEDASLEGLTVALENHTDYKTDEMLEILDLVDNEALKITLDTGNAMFVKEDPVETVEMLAPFAAYTHIKDMKHTGPLLMSVPLGQGEVDIPAMVRALKESGYEGLYSIEVDLPLWKVDEEDTSLQESIEFLLNLDKSTEREAATAAAADEDDD